MPVSRGRSNGRSSRGHGRRGRRPTRSALPALPARPGSSAAALRRGSAHPACSPGCSAHRFEGSLDEWLAAEDTRTDEVIARHGWLVQGVMAGGPRRPDLAYTVGLHGRGSPELVVFGLPLTTACPMLNDLGERVRAGETLRAGDVLRFADWPHRVHLLAVPHPERVLFQAIRTYGRPVPALQAVWDDLGGRFPWDDGYAAPRWLQPLPDSRAWRA